MSGPFTRRQLEEQVVATSPGSPEAAQAETFIKELKKG